MRFTIERYALKEVATPFFIGILVMIILLLIQRMIVITEWVVNRGVPLWRMIQTIVLMIPFFLTVVTPVALLLATLLAVNRLSADSEITAMKAAGMSVTRLLPPVIFLGLLCTIATALLSLYVIPRSVKYADKLKFDMARASARAAINVKGFVKMGQKTVMYVDSLDGDVLKGIMLAKITGKNAEPEEGVNEIFVFAKEGVISADPQTPVNRLSLTGGEIQTVERERNIYRTIQFGRFDAKIDISEEEKKSGEPGSGVTFELMGLDDLEKRKSEINARLKKLKETAPDENAARLAKKRLKVALRQIEIAQNQKFSLPVACLILALWGVPLGIQPPRATRNQGVVTSIALTLVYYVMVSGGKILAIKGVMSPSWALWGPDIIVALSGVWFLLRVSDDKPTPLTAAAHHATEWAGKLVRSLRKEKRT